MSAIVPQLRTKSHRLSEWLTHDYCPGWDPYIEWLRQPLGWFIVGTIASALVGAFLSPLAWSLASGLVALLIVGIAYPWLSVHGTQCQISCPMSDLEEGSSQFLTITVRNRCPWPVCGLIVEGFLVTPEALEGDTNQPAGDVALATIPWLSQATFRVPIEPEYRGRYPRTRPNVSCAFPLAIWTSRKVIEQVDPIVVRPRRLRLCGLPDHGGPIQHHCGVGSRAGGHGDFIGLRGYRHGDSIRSIHWAHTAKTDSLVVCQRGAAQQPLWSITLDPSCDAATIFNRENLAWRVRIAASVCTLLHQQSIPYELTILHEHDWAGSLRSQSSQLSLESSLDRLVDVPLDGCSSRPSATLAFQPSASCRIMISPLSSDAGTRQGVDADKVHLSLVRTCEDIRGATQEIVTVIDLHADVATQITSWLQRTEHGSHAA